MSRLFAFCIALVMAGCAGPSSAPPLASAPDVIAPGGFVDQGDNYSIGAGDALDVYVWRHPDLSRAVPVRPDGKISTPLVEDLQAAGKTPSQLARDIELVLQEYIKTPKVTVIVSGFQGNSLDKVRVVGQAGQPLSIPFRQGMTLLDVLIDVGGLAPDAAPKRAKILRRSNGEIVEIPVRPDLLLQRGDIRANISMQAGDVLIIPKSRF